VGGYMAQYDHLPDEAERQNLLGQNEGPGSPYSRLERL
jgi:hypothetical protein